MNFSSITGKNWIFKKFENSDVKKYSENYHLKEIVARLIAIRKNNIENIDLFLNPKIKNNLPNPFELKDMNKAVERTYECIKKRDTIGVFGDYDVDGASSTALLAKYFFSISQPINTYVPDRKKEGYGPNINAFNQLISNGSNLITVVDRYTFELIDVIDEGLTVPKYGVVYNGKAYVTNNNTFNDYTYDNDNPPASYDDFIAVINLETLSVESTIETDSYTEQIEEEDGRIYVNGSSFGYGNTINVINPSSNTVEKTISTAFGVNSFDIEDGSIYALSNNSYEVFNKDNGEQLSVLEFADLSGASNLVLEDDQAYFTIDRSVYVMEQNSITEPTTALLTYSSTSEYGAMYGFAVEDGRIYIADGGDFSSDSFVEIYSTNGSLLKNITVGLGPNGFYFN